MAWQGTGIGKNLMDVVGATFALTLVALVISRSGDVTKLIDSASQGLSKLITTATFR